MTQQKNLGQIVANWQPRLAPTGAGLAGRFARLEKLDANRHGDGLWAAVAGADHIWDYLAYGPFASQGEFATWLASRAALLDPLYFAVVDVASGLPLGCITLMEMRPSVGVIEVGHIFYSPALQKTPIATEAIYLAARIVFDQLGFRRFEWKCNDLNDPSKYAALRYGFTFEGVFRQHLVVKGRNRDTAWYAMLDGEWPTRKSTFERWLAPANFDAAGRQKMSLAQMNGVGSS